MIRIRRRALVTLILFTLFIFGTIMGLRTLKPTEGFSNQTPGIGFVAGAGERLVNGRPDVKGEANQIQSQVVLSSSDKDSSIFYDVHIFYYLWYGAPSLDQRYIHWDHVLVPHWDPKIAASHPQGRHTPPDDVASSFYPELGPYSSRDPRILESHMDQIEAAGAGVLVLSWYPPGVADDHGEPTEGLVAAVMDAAQRHSIKVAFHIQQYKGRTGESVHEDIKYIINKYGTHKAFYRVRSSMGQVLPMFYIYDSYLIPAESWADFLTTKGSTSIRGSPYDGVFIGLVVEERQKHDIVASGFDGMYTYFASNGFSFGSSHQNWDVIKSFCDSHNLLFIPSVGPGYVDTAIRPWNNHNTRNRVNGQYYQTSLQAALSVRPDIVTITSFNQWHEGTQIERAVPKKTANRQYLDYQPNQPDHYLKLTRQWAENFNKEKDKWLL
ncbi:glycoprotein endo-alpha-1,2-mannosidase-like protein isoform X1 [Synchiropus splendidus]|uniref:glycoprotein endo-alpha-1,2-mannosidase-like protein isoform X1 n=1 Tax=Synchiropus splendidus TaxID=270530 RepID=UPI00237E1B1D|nr:glycoprotein endo-alpha-1,2-mannosidase-like protein isoform X1 [Synchiropus splendidus]